MRRRASLKYTLYPFDQNKELGLSLGYAHLMRSATVTSPRLMLSSFRAPVPSLVLNMGRKFSETIYLLSSFNLIFPNFYNEQNERTGNLQSVFSAQGSVGVFVPLRVAFVYSFLVGLNPGGRIDQVIFRFNGCSECHRWN